ncbi:MAG: hypothetical protein FD143_3013 [Ignavibacteria bacterium]|nr:MAG: hypothetical protein FD143_3013 [Ignavibacteria bacterium]
MEILSLINDLHLRRRKKCKCKYVDKFTLITCVSCKQTQHIALGVYFVYSFHFKNKKLPSLNDSEAKIFQHVLAKNSQIFG